MTRTSVREKVKVEDGGVHHPAGQGALVQDRGRHLAGPMDLSECLVVNSRLDAFTCPHAGNFTAPENGSSLHVLTKRGH